VVLLPCAWILSRLGGLNALWWSFAIAETVCLALCLVLFAKANRELFKPLGE